MKKYLCSITLLFLCKYHSTKDRCAVTIQDMVLCYTTAGARISIHPDGLEQAAPAFLFSLLLSFLPLLSFLICVSFFLSFSLSKGFAPTGMPTQEPIFSRLKWNVCFSQGYFLVSFTCFSSWRDRSRVFNLHSTR